MTDADDLIYAKARYIAGLVQGSQAVEGAALDVPGYERLVELVVQLLRMKL